jgi:hypothetical protein
MPLAFTVQNQVLNGNRRETYGTVTFDNSYLTGGEPFTARDIGLNNIERVNVENSAGYQIAWNRSASAPTLIVYQGDNANASPAPGVQVPNTTNLSAVVATFRAVGW